MPIDGDSYDEFILVTANVRDKKKDERTRKVKKTTKKTVGTILYYPQLQQVDPQMKMQHIIKHHQHLS